ncbi:hypothetical protein AB6A40_007576 [Gnathostoma spinigerum]|uniref:E3 ubiquitin-protein ligase n=1 Tax=Gnathostoma spinigerum TaxID=75299 RepID=A0ABD6EW07_9BILA
MEGLRSSNEIRQAEAASELAEMLLLGNEESLPNLPIKDIVHALILLLQKEHNFELMLTAARCISNMLEALPRALPIVVDAVPCLLEKLKRIECIDVAEQSLMALEVMSKRNGKNIMAAGGIAATISHVDFFSVPSQRLAFQIAANCAMYVTVNDFSQIRDSLADLTQRLLIEDKRCLESVCILFCRLVDNLRNHAEKLREIAGPNHALLKNAQQLLLVQPPAVGPSTFQSLVRMLRNLAAKCSDLAVALINMDFARTIRFLIVGSEDGDYSLEMVNRPPGQLQELVFLAGELLPRLPMDGIFEINGVMSRSHVASHDLLPSQWYWKDDSNQWQPFSNFESGVIEMAHAASHPEISLKVNGNLYRIEFQNMIQQDPATGKERAIQRRPAQLSARDPPVQDSDRRLSLLKENPTKFDQVVRLLFPILVEIDGSSSGPALRYESLRVMLRMIQSSSPGFLKGVLSELPLAGHIASALASPRSKDLCVVASALQLCHLLLEKMSDVYIPLFTREGVAHEVEKLTKMKMESPATLPPVRSSPSVIASSSRDSSQSRTRGTGKNRSATMSASPDDHFSGRPSTSRGRGVSQPSTSGLSNPGPSDSSTQVIVSSSGGRHRRKASPESPISKKESRRKGSSSSFLHGLRLPSFRMPGQSTSHSPHEASSPNTAITSFFSSIGSTPNSLSVHTSGHSSSFGFSLSSSAAPPQASMLNHQQREKVRQWIRREGQCSNIYRFFVYV